MYLSHCKYQCILLLSRFQRHCKLRWSIFWRDVCFFPRSFCNRTQKTLWTECILILFFFVRQSCGRCGAMLLLFNTKLACVCEFDLVGLSLLPCHFHDFSWELWGYLTACLNQHISCGVRGLVKGFSYLLDWCGSSSNLASSSQFRKGDTLHHACRGLSETFTNPILQRKSRHGQTLHTVHSSACHGSWHLWKLGKQPFRMRIPQRMLVYLAQAWSCGEAIQSQGAKVMFIRNYKGMEGQEGD